MEADLADQEKNIGDILVSEQNFMNYSKKDKNIPPRESSGSPEILVTEKVFGKQMEAPKNYSH